MFGLNLTLAALMIYLMLRHAARTPGLAADDILGLPGLKFDQRSRQFRAEAILYRAIVESLKEKGIAYADNARDYASRRTHQGRLIAACLKLGNYPHEDFRALRRWAHMLGYRGHFATKSRRYSTTMRALRAARRDWHRRQKPLTLLYADKTVVTDAELEWAGRGWRTTGDALLALSAATRAREHRRVAREEMAAA